MTDDELVAVWDEAWKHAGPKETIRDGERRCLRAVAEAAVSEFAEEMIRA